MTKYKGKYNTASNRLRGWNYAGNAYYFITILTQNRECNLGYIENKKVILSDFGKIVQTEWLKSFEIRNELFLSEYIIMPNHLHAIVYISNEKGITTNFSDNLSVKTHGRASLSDHKDQGENALLMENILSQSRISLRRRGKLLRSFHRLPKSISSFVAGFKSAVNSKIDDYINYHNLSIPKYNRTNHLSWVSASLPQE